MNRELKIGGIYRHYKGEEKLYKVIAEAIDSETLEELVIYQSLYDNKEYKKGTIWARPKKMFLEKINNLDKSKYRFEYVGEDSDA